MRKLEVTHKHITGLVFVVSQLVGCGAASPEPQAADDAPEEVSAPPSSEARAESEPAGESDTQEADSPSGAAATQQDLEDALQLVLQDDALQTAMRLTEPGRFPVKIAGNDLPSGLRLMAGTKAVEVVTAPLDGKKEAVLVFVSIDLNGGSGTFKFRYDIEGIRGSAQVKKTDGRWELTSSRVSEYFSKE